MVSVLVCRSVATGADRVCDDDGGQMTSSKVIRSLAHHHTPYLHSLHGIEYKERFIILGSMESTTRSHVSSDPYLAYTSAGRHLNEGDEPPMMWRLLNGDLEEALKTAVLRSFVGLSDGVEDPLQVSVWGTAPDPLFADLFPPVQPSAAAGGEFGVTHRHDVRRFDVVKTVLWGMGTERDGDFADGNELEQTHTGGHHHDQ